MRKVGSEVHRIVTINAYCVVIREVVDGIVDVLEFVVLVIKGRNSFVFIFVFCKRQKKTR